MWRCPLVEPQKPVQTTGLAINGQAVKVTDYPAQPTPLPAPARVTTPSSWENYVPSDDIDHTDLQQVTTELSRLRMRLHQIRIELKNAERDVTRHRYLYEAMKKRYMVSLSGGSAAEREAMAELKCEDLYTNYIVAATVAKEIAGHSRDTRSDLDTLKEISNNLRRQIDLT